MSMLVMMNTAKLLVLSTAILLINGCAERKNVSPLPSISEEARNDLNKPVDCSRARNDIRILEEERASVGKQILAGARSVFPIAAVSGMLMGDYSDRVAVATGTYNSAIDAKIAQIKRACGVR